MTVLFFVAVFMILVFSFVVFFGAPFLPTLKIRTTEALDLLDLKPGQTLLELGSGDGRILKAAAKRGIYAIGYELNPILVLWTKLATYKYRRFIKVHCANYWVGKWPQTDGIYVFLLNPYMRKLNNKIEQEISQPVKVVSFAFAIPGKKPIQESNGLMLYQYKPR